MATQNLVAGGAGAAGARGQPVWPQLAVTAKAHDRGLLFRLQLARRRVRSAGTVLEAVEALLGRTAGPTYTRWLWKPRWPWRRSPPTQPSSRTRVTRRNRPYGLRRGLGCKRELSCDLDVLVTQTVAGGLSACQQGPWELQLGAARGPGTRALIVSSVGGWDHERRQLGLSRRGVQAATNVPEPVLGVLSGHSRWRSSAGGR